jgi:hypothetical protein
VYQCYCNRESKLKGRIRGTSFNVPYEPMLNMLLPNLRRKMTEFLSMEQFSQALHSLLSSSRHCNAICSTFTQRRVLNASRQTVTSYSKPRMSCTNCRADEQIDAVLIQVFKNCIKEVFDPNFCRHVVYPNGDFSWFYSVPRVSSVTVPTASSSYILSISAFLSWLTIRRSMISDTDSSVKWPTNQVHTLPICGLIWGDV